MKITLTQMRCMCSKLCRSTKHFAVKNPKDNRKFTSSVVWCCTEGFVLCYQVSVLSWKIPPLNPSFSSQITRKSVWRRDFSSQRRGNQTDAATTCRITTKANHRASCSGHYGWGGPHSWRIRSWPCFTTFTSSVRNQAVQTRGTGSWLLTCTWKTGTTTTFRDDSNMFSSMILSLTSAKWVM